MPFSEHCLVAVWALSNAESKLPPIITQPLLGERGETSVKFRESAIFFALEKVAELAGVSLERSRFREHSSFLR